MPVKIIPHRLTLITPDGEQPVASVAAGIIVAVCALQDTIQQMGTGRLEINWRADSDVQVSLQNIYRLSLAEYAPDDYGIIVPAGIAS
ncbi:MAG: hypothetical protein FJW34_21460 [Acidobacteria bacterium]|nr:hypothetical protein [Acidobacteriota bacterium]